MANIRGLRRRIGQILPSRAAPAWPSETSKCRARLAPFCVGSGIDIGPGGDPITASAVRVDLPQPYSHVGQSPVQLEGDATDLRWFRDDCLDFIYSSHVLEDFIETASVLREWLRVLRPGGNLVLYCPDEQVYRQHCRNTGQPYNSQHKLDHFSLDYVRKVLATLGQEEILHENKLVDVYSWELVCRKNKVVRQ